MPDPVEIEESNAQFLAVWILFSQGLPGHRIEHTDGVTMVLSGTDMVMLNVATLSSPATDLQDLERRARWAVELARAGGVPWLFAMSDSWSPGGDAGATADLLGRLGFQPAVSLTGMVADAIAPPQRAPSGLDLRRVADAETRAAIADLNAITYGVPIAAARASVAHESLWGDRAATAPSRAFPSTRRRRPEARAARASRSGRRLPPARLAAVLLIEPFLERREVIEHRRRIHLP
ncbi:hypothetical protein AB3662_21515 [Sorangium cellulosum]|uniref:hypothetical protein n=1 Tax=Sorangium cellulosum TaxID=56 RepID=UPI003D9A45AA